MFLSCLGFSVFALHAVLHPVSDLSAFPIVEPINRADEIASYPSDALVHHALTDFPCFVLTHVVDLHLSSPA